jgi:iron complex outermembrane receptor protein
MPLLAGIAAATAMSGIALAEEEDDDREVIVVTGTLLKRTETPSPVTVLSAEDMDLRGLIRVSDAVLNMAANNAGTIPQDWNVGWNFANGATAVSLRGLTTSSTLTLFDGERMASYPLADDGRRNFVDLNAIPEGIIDRVEVLKDGASSTYGADAIAGVVNVIAKREIQGLHFDASVGTSGEGDAQEENFGFTAGHGDLSSDGFNVYIGGEYQRKDALRVSDRGYPFNTWDWSEICNADGFCLPNFNRNGMGADGTFGLSGTGTDVPVIRPYNGTDVTLMDPNGVSHDFAPGTLLLDEYRLADLAAGCGSLIPRMLTDDQRIPVEPFDYDPDTDTYEPTGFGYTGFNYGELQCEQNVIGDYAYTSPDVTRSGLAGRVTFELGDNVEVFARADWYRVETYNQLYPTGIAGSTTPPGPVTFSPVLLPVYVCPTEFEVCDAINGTLNPNNPFAAMGDQARLLETFIRPRSTDSQADTFRAAMGVDGVYGDGWNYHASFTASHINLGLTQNGYILLQNLMDSIHDGSFNVLDQSANSQAVLDFVAPTSFNRSTSSLYQAEIGVSRELFELPGGMVEAAVGASWREEKLDNPSANPQNDAHPTERYYSINAVGAEGSRNVWSEYFEVNAPLLPTLDVNISGRHDSYSTGQSNFSPKIGAKFTPIEMFSLRGTYSEGFRIASFNEAYGLPTTGYISAGIDPTDPAYAAFIAAHEGNAYASGTYSLGLTSTGNPNLDPEKSKSYTLGAIFEPTPALTFTVDYWNIEVKDLITNANYAPAIDLYYANNGVVNLPGINVIPGLPDGDHPNALPLLGFIEYSYENANSQEVSGVDFSATLRQMLPNDIAWTSMANVSYLDNYEKTYDTGETESYAGTLSPCDVTSCSGSPDLRFDWQNNFSWQNTTVGLTMYYTAGVDEASTDYGGVKGDCEANIFASVLPYDDGTPSVCESEDIIYFDFTATQKINDTVEIYGNILNLFDEAAPFDPGAAYGLYGYNPAWAGPLHMGRYFRIGARVDF